MDTTPLFEFSDRADLRQWLEENHGTTPFCWVATTRGKEPRSGAIPYPEVVEECLCFGWIDSTVKRLEERGLVTEAGWKVFREAGKKEFVAERDLLKILRQLDGLGIRYWVDGGYCTTRNWATWISIPSSSFPTAAPVRPTGRVTGSNSRRTFSARLYSPDAPSPASPSRDSGFSIENHLSKPSWLIDVLPKQVPADRSSTRRRLLPWSFSASCRACWCVDTL